MSKSEPSLKTENTTKKDDVVIRLEREFDMYCIWKSLPPMIISPNKGTVDQVLEQLRIDDPVLIELANIKNQTEFAKHFNVSIDSLTDWNKLINKRDTLADIRIWAKRLSKNVILSMYNNAMKSDAKAYKDRENFLKVIEGWSDKLDVKHEAGDTLADILRAGLSTKNHDNERTNEQADV